MSGAKYKSIYLHSFTLTDTSTKSTLLKKTCRPRDALKQAGPFCQFPLHLHKQLHEVQLASYYGQGKKEKSNLRQYLWQYYFY